MNILITGATGFVGTNLAKKLVARGHSLVVLTRNKKKYEGYLPFPCQLKTIEELNEDLKGKKITLDSVVNLAGENVAQRWSDSIKKRIYNSRVDGTANLVNMLLANSIRLNSFVSASAIGFYGSRGDELLNEDSSLGGDYLARVCSHWEAAAQNASSISNRVSILRIGIVLGENEGALKKMLPPFKKGVGGPLGNGSNWMSWIHIEDLVNIFVDCVEKDDCSGIYNAVSPHAVTNYDFSKLLCEVLGKKLFMPVPEFSLKVMFGEMSEVLLASQKVTPARLLSEQFSFKFSDLQVALESLVEKTSSSEEKVIFEQWIPRKVEDIFSFFEDEKNLESITPPWLNFKVLKKSTPNIQKGTNIEYSLKLNGIPFRWVTHIEDWQKNKLFIDTQKKGPYKKWHHTHTFESLGSGTLIKDVIRYELPMGILGSMAAGWKVTGDVNSIFKYRAQVIKDKFSSKV